jgi:arylsulfatase A
VESILNRREFIKAVGLGAATVTISGCTSTGRFCCGKSSSDRPNFVIIFTDDQGYADLGCYGAEGFQTPNLDRMAAEGVRFTDFYVAAALCTPSRAALLTGCYPQRVGLPWVVGPEGPEWAAGMSNIGISSQEQTIAEILKTRGYATACFGKWHLGHHRQFLPTHHGFDEYFGLPYSNDMCPQNDNVYPPLPLIDGERAVEYNPDQTKLTTWYTERAVKFIEKNRDKLFFLYVPHSMPHVPLYVSEKFKGKSKQGLYGDVIMEIDWSAGQILSALNRLGIDERTLVIFTSDNGPWLAYGDHAGSAKPLREGKGTTLEGGMRVPCIMRWPGRIPEGTVCNQVATAMDILPTLAKLAGADLPAKRIDGKDIWSLMSGKAGAKSPYEAFFYYNGWQLEAVRSGKWKLHFPHSYRSLAEAGSGGTQGKERTGEIGTALFDLENDISEQNDVSAKHQDVVERLSALADKMREDLGDSARQMTGRNRRPPGRI